jgi:hypothetical protein
VVLVCHAGWQDRGACFDLGSTSERKHQNGSDVTASQATCQRNTRAAGLLVSEMLSPQLPPPHPPPSPHPPSSPPSSFPLFSSIPINSLSLLTPPNLSSPLSTAFYDELYSFDLFNLTWTLLAASAVPDGTIIRPSARYRHGFTSVGGKLYVHGGFTGGNVYVGIGLWTATF